MSALHELRQTIARLRAPDGCPWDQEQTHESLVRCLIDEVSELIETIDRADMDHMREELGDVLIQVYFHAQIAEEAGLFDLEAVAREVNEKLIRRHPHVFGDHQRLDTAGQVITKWEQIVKQKLPVPTAADEGKIQQTAENLTDDELGKQLWILAAAARSRGLDPEGALRRQTDRVIADVETHGA